MIAEGVDVRAIWDHEAQPKEWLMRCPLCNAPRHAFRWERGADRYGYESRAVSCDRCSLNFLNPRMTKEAYAEFYASGAYRRLVSAFHGRDVMATIEQEQAEYGAQLGKLLRPWTDGHERRLLDIGGSTGVVARAVAEEMEYRPLVTVIDPAVAEAERSLNKAGVEVYARTLEDFHPNGKYWQPWDIVTLCQTADHLLDLMGSLKKIRTLLTPDGVFWSDIVDFDVTREVKIDHPFNLTERTYREFLKRAGFALLQVNYAPDGKHIGFLCKGAK